MVGEVPVEDGRARPRGQAVGRGLTATASTGPFERARGPDQPGRHEHRLAPRQTRRSATATTSRSWAAATMPLGRQPGDRLQRGRRAREVRPRRGRRGGRGRAGRRGSARPSATRHCSRPRRPAKPPTPIAEHQRRRADLRPAGAEVAPGPAQPEPAASARSPAQLGDVCRAAARAAVRRPRSCPPDSSTTRLRDRARSRGCG